MGFDFGLHFSKYLGSKNSDPAFVKFDLKHRFSWSYKGRTTHFHLPRGNL